ncbi:MAG: hypothetical protein K2J71_02115 [Oscillospiraceae bacterium]|nr:hypothetical protein [Oscillospiraceae bacterium]
MKLMKHKKILSAVMAMAMLGSMQAIAVNAEETENEESIENIEAVEAIENSESENDSNPEQDQNSAQESETIPDATDSNPEPDDVPATTSQTDAPATTMTTIVTTVTTIATPATSETDAEIISSDLGQPKIGDFKVSPAPSGADGENAVISWDAVEGADGYQVYRTLVEQKDPDTPVSYSFDVKGTSYQTAGSTAYKETIKVRAFKLVDGERVYSAWSENKTVYLNGMEEPGNSSSGESTTIATTTGANSTGTTTTKSSSTTTTKATTTKAESTTSTEQLTGSPKTSDSRSAGLWISIGVATAISASATRRKKNHK